jgi:uncharacterized integral membrane protein (TIGR00697 family)
MEANKQLASPQTEKLLPVFSGVFTAVLVLSNILASKMVHLGPFVFDGGTLLFPISYIFGDLLTEVYGYKRARSVIWTGLAMLAVMAVNVWVIGILPAESTWGLQGAYDSILGLMPRIVLASLVAYFCGEYSNAVLLSKIKVATKGRGLWVRTIASTLVGEGLDCVLFVTIAFAGTYPAAILAAMIVSNYLFKCGIEIAFTPVTYLVVGVTKKVEGCDTFDRGETYNPLPIR